MLLFIDSFVWLLVSYILITLASMLLLIFVWFFRRCDAQEALVRCGMGGYKITQSGGLLCFPIIHRYQYISLKTLRLDFTFEGENAIRYGECAKIPVRMSLYVRVGDEHEAIYRSLRITPITQENLVKLLQSEIHSFVSASITDTKEAKIPTENGKPETDTNNLRNFLYKEYGLNLSEVSITKLDMLPNIGYGTNTEQTRGTSLKDLWQHLVQETKTYTNAQNTTEIAQKLSRNL